MAIITLNNNSLSSVTALPASIPTGSLIKLAETNFTSATTSISMDGYFTSDYDIYVAHGSNFCPSGSGNTVPSIRYRRNNADVTSGNYKASAQQAYNGGSNHNGDFSNTLMNMVKDSSVKAGNDVGISFKIIFYDPLGGKSKMCNWECAYQYSTDRWYTTQGSGVDVTSNAPISGFTIFNAGGEQFDRGVLHLFGFKTS